MKSRMRGFRSMAIGLCVAAGMLLAPAAFARSHVSVGIGLPGVSVGYHSGWHGRGYGYVGFGGYSGGYYPGYYGYGYGPYYPSPAYYSRPVYAGSCYARPFYDGRGYYHPGYRYSC